MAYEDYPKNIPEASMLGLVAGGLLALFTNNGFAFLLGFFGVSWLAYKLLNEKDKD